MSVTKVNVKRPILFAIVGIIISIALLIVFSQVVSDISAKMAYDATLSVKKKQPTT